MNVIRFHLKLQLKLSMKHIIDYIMIMRPPLEMPP